MPDTKLFKGSRAKLARARENLQGLELEFQRFSDSKPYTLRQEYDSEADEVVLVYYPVGEIPDNWSVIVGEVLFNLRSALDLAIEELTVREQGTPLDKTEFPIFDDKEKFSLTKKDGVTPAPLSGLYRIRGLSQKTIDCVESLQPYNLTDADKVSILSLLHEMNNRDKHRELHLCRQLALSTKIFAVRDIPNFVNWGLVVGVNLDERAVISRLKVAKPLPDNEVYMDADVSIQIVFDQRSSSAFKKQEGVIKILTGLANGVDRVLVKLENSL